MTILKGGWNRRRFLQATGVTATMTSITSPAVCAEDRVIKIAA